MGWSNGSLSTRTQSALSWMHAFSLDGSPYCLALICRGIWGSRCCRMILYDHYRGAQYCHYHNPFKALTFTRQQHEAVMAFTTKHSDSRSLGFLSSCWLLVWICEYLLYQDLPQYGLTCTHGVSVILYSTFIGLNDLTKTYFKKNNLNLSEA